MKTIVEPADNERELLVWAKARAQIWMSHVTHKRLAIMLSRKDEPEVLFVVAIGCEHIVGPFSWPDASIAIVPSVNQAGEPTCEVRDAAAGFELRCSSVTLVRAPATDFPTTFENFLSD